MDEYHVQYINKNKLERNSTYWLIPLILSANMAKALYNCKFWDCYSFWEKGNSSHQQKGYEGNFEVSDNISVIYIW